MNEVRDRAEVESQTMSDEELLENESGLEINGDDDSLSIYPNGKQKSQIAVKKLKDENINHHRHIQQLIPHCRMLGIGKQSVTIFLCDDLPVKNQSVREMKFV